LLATCNRTFMTVAKDKNNNLIRNILLVARRSSADVLSSPRGRGLKYAGAVNFITHILYMSVGSFASLSYTCSFIYVFISFLFIYLFTYLFIYYDRLCWLRLSYFRGCV